MATTNTYHPQTARFLSTVATCMPALASDVMQGWINNPRALRKALQRALCPPEKEAGYPVLAETTLLKPVAQVTVPARTKPFNVAAFYQTGTGLYIWDSFRDRLAVEARTVLECAPARPYVTSLLKKDACDNDIRKELPESHLSTIEDIAGFIEAQPNGKKGVLLTNGYANIFYVEGRNGEVFAVCVLWNSDGDSWDVNDWGQGGNSRWSAGRQVLCPGNAAL